MSSLSCLELCAGAGGQALGIEQAGYEHAGAVEIDADACETLRTNRPSWPVFQADLHDFSGKDFRGVDLVAGGVPCPPFSVAGHQLGSADERDLFPQALRIIREARPKAVLLENVKGLAAKRFDDYRGSIISELAEYGYRTTWQLLQAADYGVPQLRPRFILVALRASAARRFEWPDPSVQRFTVGSALEDLMASDGWRGARQWASNADKVAPTLVGGSRKHGGPDLGPTRARAQWATMGVDGRGISDEPPQRSDSVNHHPRLTLQMAARLQGFPDDWKFAGRKTSAYRQIGNAFPPPVARAVGMSIAAALGVATSRRSDAAAADGERDLELVG